MSVALDLNDTTIDAARFTLACDAAKDRNLWWQRIQANLLLLLAAALWGFGNVPQKLILANLGPVTTTGLRCAIACVCVLPLALAEARRTAAFGAVERWLVLGTSVQFAAGLLFSQISFGLTTATNTGFLTNTTTVLVPLAAWVVLRRKPRPSTIFAAITTLLGAFLMSGGAIGFDGSGDAIAMLAAACFAGWMLSLESLLKRSARPTVTTTAQFALTAILTLPVGLMGESISVDRLVNALPLLIFISVLSLAIGWTISGIAMQRASPTDAAVILAAESVFGGVASNLVLGEQLGNWGLAGACLVLGGILIVGIAPCVAQRSPPLRDTRLNQ